LEICGGIASGKTTLARLLRRASFKPVLEEFQRNPFLGAFYEDPDRYAIETELGFLLQHLHSIKKSAVGHRVSACDFSFILDHAYAKVTLPKKHQRQFEALLNWLIGQIGEAPLVVYLKCPPTVELERIRRRGRAWERGISKAYLASIDNQLLKLLRTTKSKVLLLDSHKNDFAADRKVQRQVLADVQTFIAQGLRGARA
jgi:deoxyguanosine kinase